MDLFFNQLKRPQSLSKVLSIDISENGNFIAVLQKELNNNGQNTDKKVLEKMVDTKIEAMKVGYGTRFNILVTSYLKFIADVNPWSIWDNIDLIFNYYTDLTNLVISLNNSTEAQYEYHLCVLYQKMTKYIIRLSKKLDLINEADKNIFTTQVCILLSKYLQTIKPLIYRGANNQIDSIYGDDNNNSNNNNNDNDNMGVSTKFKILLWVVNRLNNLYFYIGSPKSSYTIFSNMSHKIDLRALQNLPSSTSLFNMIDVLEYRYLLGRSYMIQNKVVDSYYQLNKCFDGLQDMLLYYNRQQISNQNDYHSGIMITKLKKCLNQTFKLLIPMGLIIGKRPHRNIVNNNNNNRNLDLQLVKKYETLTHAVTQGNLQKFNFWIDENKDFLIKNNMYIILIDKLPLLIVRNCVKTIFEIYCLRNSEPSNKIGYNIIEMGLKYSLYNKAQTGSSQGDQIINNLFSMGINAENLLSTLITYNWVKGNIFPMSKVLLTMKSNNINDIFPDVNEKIMHRYPLNDADSWLDMV